MRWRHVACVLGLALSAGALSAGASAAVAIAAADQAPRLLVSRQLAGELGLRAGDLVQLAAAEDEDGGSGTAFRVAGMYEPMPDPARLTASRREVRLHLPDLLALTADPADPLAGEAVDRINVLLTDPDDAEAFARDVAQRVPGLSARAATGDRTGIFVALEQFHTAIALVTVVASTVFLLALMIMLVDERGQSVGVLRLMGLPRRRILLQVIVEGLVVAAGGTLFGLLLATLAQAPINWFFQWRYDTSLVFVEITRSIAWRSAAVAVPLGVLASVAASWTLLRRDVMTLARR